ncbi:MAG: hypothetical protein J6Y44_01390, partial [Clostridia bacterium]|nr:hypothetical protein [Clostridia bacterium]
THPHEDHIGGMPKIFEKYQVDYVFRPYVYSTYSQASNLPEGFNQGSTRSSYSCNSKIYYTFLQCIVDEGSGWSFFNKDSDISFVVKDDALVEYTLSFDFLTPTADVADISYKSKLNNYSPIIKVSYGGFDILLTGDAEKEAEKELCDYYTDLNYLDVDLLKVGHHGSDTSSTEDFLLAVKPEISVISCGVGNSYHHPIASTLNGLVTVGSTIYRTDVQGNIILTVDEHGAHNIVTTKTGYNEADLYVPGV